MAVRKDSLIILRSAKKTTKSEHCTHTLVISVARSFRPSTSMVMDRITSAIPIARQNTELGGYAMRIKRIRPAGKADVYNMEVEETHDFVIQGGVISHNCADETRYMCMSRPIKPMIPTEKKIIISDPLNMFTKNRR